MKRTTLSVERNKEPILEVLNEYIKTDEGRLLEIGSGTGEHAVYFAKHFRNIYWVPSDLKGRQKSIAEWVKSANLANLHRPKILRAGVDDFPDKKPFDYVFSANTLHIMPWKEAKSLFKLLSKRLREGSQVFLYGPLNYDGDFTSDSNKEFDEWLKTERGEKCGIRNFEDVCKAMTKGGFKLLKDHEMPSNNRLLVFERLAFK